MIETAISPHFRKQQCHIKVTKYADELLPSANSSQLLNTLYANKYFLTSIANPSIITMNYSAPGCYSGVFCITLQDRFQDIILVKEFEIIVLFPTAHLSKDSSWVCFLPMYRLWDLMTSLHASE